MRLMRQFPQLPQISLSRSMLSRKTSAAGEIFYLLGARALQPLPQFILPKSPLPADLYGWQFMALRPKAHRSRRYSQPFCDSSGG
jgi:hypothetical protein